MSKLFKSLDLFAENHKIYFNQKDKIKTRIGGYLSIFIIATTLLFTWFIGKDIIYKSNPFNYQQQIVNKNFLNNTINKTTFPLAFSLTDFNSVPLKNYSSYLKFDFDYITATYDSEGNLVNFQKDPINLANCQYEDFPIISHKEFDTSIPLLCPQMNSTFLYGYWAENSLSYLSLTVRFCDFDNAENECHTYEEIKDYISENLVNVGVRTFDTQIVVTNYSQPLQKYFTSSYKFLTDYNKVVNFFVERNLIQTDAGIIFESIESEEFYKLRETQLDTGLFDKTYKYILSYNFYSSNLQTIYVRKYIKIPEILASIGGLFKLFTFIGYFINMNFALISKNLTTISCLFSFEGEILEKKNPKLLNNFFTVTKNCSQFLNDSHLNNNIDNRVTINNEVDSVLKKVKSRRRAVISLSISDYVHLLCRKKKIPSKNVLLYKKALTRIRDYFDIIFIINKLIEVEIIKEIILNEEQRKVLENIKPILTEEETKKTVANISEFEVELSNLLNNQNKTEVDNKILKIITTFH